MNNKIIIEGRDVLEAIINNFGFSNQYDIEIDNINHKYVIKVIDKNISDDDYEKDYTLNYGLAVEVEGKVTQYEDGFLEGGKTHLYVFGEESYLNGDYKKDIVPIGHECKGMMYEVAIVKESKNGEDIVMRKVDDIKDVNMAINAISNFLMQTHVGGGLFRINQFMIDAYKKLKEKGFRLDKIEDKIAEELYNGFETEMYLYLGGKKDEVIPIKTINYRFKEIVDVKPELIKKEDLEFILDINMGENKTEELNDALRELIEKRRELFDKDEVNRMIEKRYKRVLTKLANKKSELFDKDDVDKLIKGRMYTGTLNKLIEKRSNLFEEKHVDMMIENGYRSALINLIEYREELFDRKHVDMMIKDRWYYSILRDLVEKRSELFDENQVNKLIKEGYDNPIIRSIYYEKVLERLKREK